VPQSLPFNESPLADLQAKSDPCPTVTSDEAFAVAEGTGAGAEATAGAGMNAGTATDGDGGADDSTGALDDDAAGAGTLGPRRTPASFGQATPTTNPMAAMTPTRVHAGRSSAAEGT
jgi:hypothetical protein